MIVSHKNHDDPKRNALASSGTLHPNPELVSDKLFRDNPFFDPYDTLQVKYEMLRRVRVDGYSVSRASSLCGLSRPTYYQANEAFNRDGLVGLLPEKKGPKRAHKLTVEVLDFIEAQLETQPRLTPQELAQLVHDEYDIEVHPKSIPRALARSKKKRVSPPEKPTRPR
jgi:transposase